MAERVDCVIIGAGVVGLACAAALAHVGRDVLVLEAENAIGTHCSSRNSEVIHAGIYYPEGSLKARLCREGRDRLYAFAAERGIAHRQTGKLIVASNTAQQPALDAIFAAACANGVGNLRPLSTAGVRALEPNVSAVSGLFSPSTGIIDSHALMLALVGEIEAHGGMVVTNSAVARGMVGDDCLHLFMAGDDKLELIAHSVVNAGGLFAPDVARTINGLNAAHVPEARYAIGHYYRLSGRSPCAHLVYPVPEPGGLGIHLTLDMGGQAKFGPDVRWIDRIDYGFDDCRRESFVAAIKAYLPGLEAERLGPDYTGIRPKISGPGELAADFRIDGPDVHGVSGLVNLFGIESPGLTAALAIGPYVAGLISR